jgi:G3E family GTPase
MVTLNSGCLCCTVRGDLVRTMSELFLKRSKGEVTPFKRMVVETTGLADPAPILHTLMTDPLLASRYRLDGVVTTVDGVNGTSTLDNHEEAVKQAAVADRLLLTKVDIADAPKLDELKHRLQHLNPGAPSMSIAGGEIDPNEILNAGLYNPDTKTADVKRWLHEEAYEGSHEHGHGNTLQGLLLTALAVARPDFSAENEFLSGRVDRGRLVRLGESGHFQRLKKSTP